MCDTNSLLLMALRVLIRITGNALGASPLSSFRTSNNSRSQALRFAPNRARTYDPARPAPDPEGDYVPMYLANVFFQNRKTWTDLKQRLQTFGRDAGVFDEISIKALG